MGLAFHTYSVCIDLLDKLHELGFPVMTRPGAWPEPTRADSIVFLVTWWLVYFLIALIVGLFIRRFGFHGRHTV